MDPTWKFILDTSSTKVTLILSSYCDFTWSLPREDVVYTDHSRDSFHQPIASPTTVISHLKRAIPRQNLSTHNKRTVLVLSFPDFRPQPQHLHLAPLSPQRAGLNANCDWLNGPILHNDSYLIRFHSGSLCPVNNGLKNHHEPVPLLQPRASPRKKRPPLSQVRITLFMIHVLSNHSYRQQSQH